MRNLSHENIVNLHEVYESDNIFYMVLDLMNGKFYFRLNIFTIDGTLKDLFYKNKLNMCINDIRTIIR